MHLSCTGKDLSGWSWIRTLKSCLVVTVCPVYFPETDVMTVTITTLFPLFDLTSTLYSKVEGLQIWYSTKTLQVSSDTCKKSSSSQSVLCLLLLLLDVWASLCRNFLQSLTLQDAYIQYEPDFLQLVWKPVMVQSVSHINVRFTHTHEDGLSSGVGDMLCQAV